MSALTRGWAVWAAALTLTALGLVGTGTGWAADAPATVGGLVVDRRGAPAPGATIILTKNDAGDVVIRVAVADAGGRFRLDRVAAGLYAVEARLQTLRYERDELLAVEPAAAVQLTLILPLDESPPAR